MLFFLDTYSGQLYYWIILCLSIDIHVSITSLYLCRSPVWQEKCVNSRDIISQTQSEELFAVFLYFVKHLYHIHLLCIEFSAVPELSSLPVGSVSRLSRVLLCVFCRHSSHAPASCSKNDQIFFCSGKSFHEI